MSRLKGKNIVYLRQILFILDTFKKFLGSTQNLGIFFFFLFSSFFPFFFNLSKKTNEGPELEKQLMKVDDFLIELKIDNINLHKICNYLKISELAKKLNGFLDFKKNEKGLNSFL